MAGKWTIVGISGCTNSGKTTLSKFLSSSFPGSVVINQDHYFRSDDSPEHIIIPELNHKNWERLEAVDWEAMMETLDKTLQTPPQNIPSLLIIEGHIIFNYPGFRKLFHKKYFLNMNKEECYKRRVHRVYTPPDIPGYFEKCVWPMYLSNLEEIKKNCENIIFLDGTGYIKTIHETVLKDLQKYFRQ
ncbi:nicotinamide riboside kinase 1-like [Uloborus diversus]|uniref:nicotinamide riboside kinase 1-like n=1 Tax=Uloborus diversus TaxID=327109 RepID=UPI00240A2398|nr:nicotinamide riboside kinase 1-like [Uloborus diversus]